MFQTLVKGFKSFTSLFSKLRFSLGSKLKTLLSKKEKDSSLFEALEKLFFEADFGGEMTMELVDQISSFIKKNPKSSTDEVFSFIRMELEKILTPSPSPAITTSPHIVLIVGTNGSGKTTTIAKLAHAYKKEGKKVMVAACDTFRAAATDQLDLWSKQIGVEIVKGQAKGDPSSVAFDAVAAAKARGTDILLIDTAGRLQTKTDLMHELEKVRRVCNKQCEGSPHTTYLVLDATIGQNAVDQVRTFHQFTPLDGIILTKLDGSAKGGVVVAIKKETNLDTKWVGLGEKKEDLVPFDSSQFIDALLK